MSSTWPAPFPLTPGADVQDWDKVVSIIVRAVHERGSAAGCIFPRPSHVFYSGIVPAGVTETSFTDSSAAWCGGDGDGSGPYWNPWACVTSGPISAETGTPCADPAPWVVVFDDLDPVKVVQAQITGWTNAGQLRYQNVRNSFVSGEVAANPPSGNAAVSVAALVGRRYYIIGYDRLWWSDRVTEWPNANEYAAGTVTAYTDAPESPTHGLLRDDGAGEGGQGGWIADEHKGRDLLVYGDDTFADGRNILHRVSITGNTSRSLSFATQTWKPLVGSAYVVVGAGKRALPGRAKHPLLAYYRGVAASFASHDVDDSLGAATMPAGSISLDNGLGCLPADNPLWDWDLWSDGSDDLNAPCALPCNRSYNPDLYKAFPRGQQLALEQACGAYVDGSAGGGSRIPFLSAARAFALAGINNTSGTAGAPIGGAPSNEIAVSGVGAGLPYYPIQVAWAIVRTDWQQDKSGYGLMINSTTLQDQGPGAQFDTDDAGFAVILSAGWTRFVERRFKRLYAIDGVFIPDVQSDGMGGFSVIDPASTVNYSGDCAGSGVGAYYKRAASTRYTNAKEEEASWSNPQGFAREDGDPFVTGEYARYDGDNFADPTVITETGVFLEAGDPLAPYYDRFSNVTAAPANQALIDGQRFGQASEGGASWLRDPAQNWFNFGWFGGGGEMRSESGTASSGSSTSLTDNAKTPAAGAANCFWALSRFQGFSGPYVGFTVEVLLSGSDFDDPAAVIARRLITAGSATAVSVTWAEALPGGASASGKQYRIQEPYRLNRWKDHTGKLIPPNGGTPISVTFSGNGKDVLYFPALAGGLIAGMGWRYQIDEPEIGGVWKWNGSKWVVPSGADAHRVGVPAGTGGVTPRDFFADQMRNLPTFAKRFGRTVPGEVYGGGDAMSMEVIDELYRFINVLQRTRVDIAWDGFGVFPSDDTDGGTDTGGAIGPYAIDFVIAAWGTGVSPDTLSTDSGPPLCTAITEAKECFDCTGANCGDLARMSTCHSIGLHRRKSNGVARVCPRIGASATFYNYADAIGGVPPGGACPGGTGCTTGGVVSVFDDNGDPVAYRSWTSFGGGAVSSAGTASASLGGLGIPNGADYAGFNCARAQGYEVTDGLALVDWSFTHHA